jgi:D-threo-aldose 1-dehydrogenase
VTRPLSDRPSGAAALGFGGAPLGNLYAPVDDATARATVDAAWDAGIRTFDTAPHYGLGLSERRMGAALAGRPRDEFVLSTKVGRLLVDNATPTGSDLATGGFAVPDDLTRRPDFTRDGVRRSLDESLARLGLDRLDLVLVHDAEDHLDVALREAVPALAELRDQGVVGAIGAGMNYVEPLRAFAATGAVDVVMVAGRWSLLDRSAAGLLDDCRAHGVDVLAAGPFNSGLLAQEWPADDATFDYGPAPADVLARARAMATACRDSGVPLPAAALQFPLRAPAVSRVVAGFRSPDEVREAAAHLAVPVPESTWARIESVLSISYGG